MAWEPTRYSLVVKVYQEKACKKIPLIFVQHCYFSPLNAIILILALLSRTTCDGKKLDKGGLQDIKKFMLCAGAKL